MIIALFSIAALVFYGLGFYIGLLTGREEVIEKRKEMGIDEEKEEDPYDVFYKQ